MKALAEFILRGRVQALLVALIGNFFPLISTATVALVSLSKSAKEGTLLFLWVSLVLVLMQQLGTNNPLPTAVTIASLGIMVLAATVHKILASWQWTLLVTIVMAVVCAQGFSIFMGTSVIAFVDAAQDMLNAVKGQQQNVQLSFAITEPVLLGLVANILAIGCMMSLMLARWWHAAVQNPGGFQKEFHGFSVDAKIAVISIMILIAGQFFSKSAQIWVDIVVLPLIIAGIALIHYTVKFFDQGRQWLAFLYVGMIMVGKPVLLLLVVLGLTDSLIDLRSRLEGYKNSKA